MCEAEQCRPEGEDECANAEGGDEGEEQPHICGIGCNPRPASPQLVGNPTSSNDQKVRHLLAVMALTAGKCIFQDRVSLEHTC